MLCTLIFVRDQIKSQRSNSQQLSHYISDVHGQKDQGQAAIKSTTLRLMIIFFNLRDKDRNTQCHLKMMPLLIHTI